MTAAPSAQKLDDLSMLLGEMRSEVGSLKEYVHQFRHDEKNQQQLQLSFQEQTLRQVEKLREDIQADRLRDRADAAAIRLADRAEIEQIKRDLDALKGASQRREGVMGAVDWLIKSPLVGWMVSAGLAIWAFATGRLHT